MDPVGMTNASAAKDFSSRTRTTTKTIVSTTSRPLSTCGASRCSAARGTASPAIGDAEAAGAGDRGAARGGWPR
jgi:hypothetical protein